MTISGSGFGSTQGSGQLLLGSMQGGVTSWSDAQIVATVAQGSTSGSAQVIQNGVLSNAVAFTVNIPQITSVTPSSGAAGTSVTVSGSGFGATQGSGIVWLGSVAGNVTSWSDAQVVATVASTAVSGIAKIQQNGIWSNAFTFIVPSTGGTPVTITPNVVGMLVGDNRSLQALDNTGKPVTGLTWTSSDTTVATLSTDDPPIITAVAPGNVTITGGNASADLTIYPGDSFPLGAVQWSLTNNGGAIPAVPSNSGVDVFSFDGFENLQALTPDGEIVWTATLAADESIVPDFLGGAVVVANPGPSSGSEPSFQTLDSLTGERSPAYTFTAAALGEPAGLPILVHPDGTIITLDNNSVIGIDPSSGTAKFSIPLDQGVASGNGNCGEFTPFERPEPPNVGQPIIAGDGFAYVPYAYSLQPLAKNQKVCNDDGSESETVHTDTHL